MKRIATANPLLENTASNRGTRHQENRPQDDELASILSDIFVIYSGSLPAFFEDLEKEARGTSENGKKSQKVGSEGKK
jgi:hypothetical protein